MSKTIATSILMIRPAAFSYNEDTASDNCFQKVPDLKGEQLQLKALEEFDLLVSKLKNAGINVLVFQDSEEPKTPDSVFPNNWISFHEDGRMALFPLKSEVRRKERDPAILEFILENGFGHDVIEDFRDSELEGQFLEGTGSMVLDRSNRICYACLSERTDPYLLIEFCEVFDFKPVMFLASVSKEGVSYPVYHTNVMMSVADEYALVCLDCIEDEEGKKLLLKSLKSTNKKIVELTEEQLFQFAGNALQLSNEEGKKILVMSASAYESLSQEQIGVLKEFNEIIYSDLHTIENAGGGSARCMIAEIFLPREEQ